MSKSTKHSVLFVCVTNAGKSQGAAGLIRQLAGATVEVQSAGIRPGTSLDELSVESLDEIGVDIATETPKPIDPQVVSAVDVIDRMRLVRDDIAAHVVDLSFRPTPQPDS